MLPIIRPAFVGRPAAKVLHALTALSLWITGALADQHASYVLTTFQTVSVLEQFQECDVCPEMIVMPMGSFMMGATPEESRNPFDFYGPNATLTMRQPGELNIIPSEHPRHSVDMDLPYAMARNETTHAEWMACVDAKGCSHVPEHRVPTLGGYVPLGPDHPVINVSYFDILEYAAWLNTQVDNVVYRLPTEAEWEYAARAGTKTRFAQGDDLSVDQANFSRRATENIRRSPMPDLVDRERPVTVDELDAANGWGLRHMSGNVGEWTLSCWTDTHLGLASDSDYLAYALSQESCRRVSKGGRFGSAMDNLRPANRYKPLETSAAHYRGFRLIRELTPKEGS